MILNIISQRAPIHSRSPGPQPRSQAQLISGGSTMNESTKPSITASLQTRRQAITGIAMSLVVCSRVMAETQQPAMKHTPATTANSKRTSLHQEIDFKASPQRIYTALLSSKDFAAFTGAPAEIDPKAGGAFSLFGGMVVGRNVELVPNQRIVQAWRVIADFPEGVYTLVKFELKPRRRRHHRHSRPHRLPRGRLRSPQRRMAFPLLGTAKKIPLVTKNLMDGFFISA